MTRRAQRGRQRRSSLLLPLLLTVVAAVFVGPRGGTGFVAHTCTRRAWTRRSDVSGTTLRFFSKENEEATIASSFNTATTTATATNSNDHHTTAAAVTLVDPTTNCQVVLLGCFHGTTSSAQDVATVVTPETDVIVLELCTSRFVDLRRQRYQQQRQQGERNESRVLASDRSMSNNSSPPWSVRYLQMVTTTIRNQGLATGLAAGLLSGVSGLQSAMSGFEPGLEFTTALVIGEQYGCDLVLADQNVDETLRKLGTLPITAWDMVRGDVDDETNGRPSRSFPQECLLHLNTLGRAILGNTVTFTVITRKGDNVDPADRIPQIQVLPVLLRNQAAVQDLVRLLVPATLLVVFFSQFLALVLGETDWVAATTMNGAPHVDGMDDLSISSWIVHMAASSLILASGLLAMTPVVKVILTERDAILTKGIRVACQRAGNGGRVVAVLGLLHVNGVAQRLLTEHDLSEEEDVR